MNFIKSVMKKILFLVVLLIFLLLAIFNYNSVDVNFFGITTLNIPLFLVIFGAFLFGSIVNILYFIFQKK